VWISSKNACCGGGIWAWVVQGVVVGLVVGWLGGSLMQSVCVVGSSQPAATPPPRHVAALPDRPSRLLYAEELRPRLDACTFEAVVSRGHDVQHCPQCAAMMCTEECRYDGSWCGRARDFACATADRLPADSVAFFPSISADPFPVPRCAPFRPVRSRLKRTLKPCRASGEVRLRKTLFPCHTTVSRYFPRVWALG